MGTPHFDAQGDPIAPVRLAARGAHRGQGGSRARLHGGTRCALNPHPPTSVPWQNPPMPELLTNSLLHSRRPLHCKSSSSCAPPRSSSSPPSAICGAGRFYQPSHARPCGSMAPRGIPPPAPKVQSCPPPPLPTPHHHHRHLSAPIPSPRHLFAFKPRRCEPDRATLEAPLQPSPRFCRANFLSECAACRVERSNTAAVSPAEHPCSSARAVRRPGSGPSAADRPAPTPSSSSPRIGLPAYAAPHTPRTRSAASASSAVH